MCDLSVTCIYLKLPGSVLRCAAVHEQRRCGDQPLPGPRPPPAPRHAGECWRAGAGRPPKAPAGLLAPCLLWILMPVVQWRPCGWPAQGPPDRPVVAASTCRTARQPCLWWEAQ